MHTQLVKAIRVRESRHSVLIRPPAAGDAPGSATAPVTLQGGPGVTISSVGGQPSVVYEGSAVDTVLMMRLDGDAVGPVKVLVSNPVYPHDRQHPLIPE